MVPYKGKASLSGTEEGSPRLNTPAPPPTTVLHGTVHLVSSGQKSLSSFGLCPTQRLLAPEAATCPFATCLDSQGSRDCQTGGWGLAAAPVETTRSPSCLPPPWKQLPPH